ncbi:kelch repeat-containing protein, partial [Toxoplasma gondii MAS]
KQVAKKADSLLFSEGVSTETSASLPPPRCSHTASLWRSEGKSKIVVFGGHGGYRYTRKALNDVWILDLTDLAWTEVRYTGNAPAPRYARVEERSVSRCSDFFQFEVICIRLSRHTCRGTAA